MEESCGTSNGEATTMARMPLKESLLSTGARPTDKERKRIA